MLYQNDAVPTTSHHHLDDVVAPFVSQLLHKAHLAGFSRLVEGPEAPIVFLDLPMDATEHRRECQLIYGQMSADLTMKCQLILLSMHRAAARQTVTPDGAVVYRKGYTMMQLEEEDTLVI